MDTHLSLFQHLRRGAGQLVASALVLSLICAAGAADNGVRPSALAGRWYPSSPSLAASEVQRLLRSTADAPRVEGRIRALVVPHAGWRYSGAAAASAFRLLEPGDFSRVVIVAPAHRHAVSGYSVPEFRAYETPLGEVPLCADAVASLRKSRAVGSVTRAHRQEHAIEIELPFLQQVLGDFCIVPILAGQASPGQRRKLAEQFASLDDGSTLFVFSSDFTHHGPGYNFEPFKGSASDVRAAVRELDQRAVDLLMAKDGEGFRSFLEQTRATICGREGLKVLLEMLSLSPDPVHATHLASYASVDLPGAGGADSVSYEALAFSSSAKAKAKKPLSAPRPPSQALPAGPAAETLPALPRLARAALESDIRGSGAVREALSSLPADPALDRLQAVFVTLNRADPEEIRQKGRLRGCIGQVLPTYPLHQAVIVSALGAALDDPRFERVKAAELDRLEVEVTLLSVPRAVSDWKEIELGKHGIVLSKNGHRAVFLPQVPGEQGWTLEQTLEHLARKAGLRRGEWREGASFEVFTGQVLDEVH